MSERLPYPRQCAARASALDPGATLKVEELNGELEDRYTIVILTDNLQQAARAANATALMLGGELVEHRPTMGMFTDPTDEPTEHDVSGRLG